MADRTSAALFAEFFELLAENPTVEHELLARKVWRMTNGYDFHPCQMDCNDALEKLGLAREVGDDIEYGPVKP